MLGMAPDYDHLPVINKVEVFEYALDSTSGEDLHKVRGEGGEGSRVLQGCDKGCAVINKVEVFEYALDSTSGEDLHEVRW